MPKYSLVKNTSLIVLYKSRIMESTTVISLLNAKNDDVQLKIIIWNNGSNLLEQDDVKLFELECNTKGIYFEIYQDIRNISLSHLYNFCISRNRERDFFTIFDQDSILSSNFLSNLIVHASFELICPKVYDTIDIKRQRWPRDLRLNLLIAEGEFKIDDVFTLGSGLSLSQSLISKLMDKYGNVFCEDYVFYGVDGELLSRVKQLNLVKTYCCGSIQHSEHGALEKSDMPESAKLEYGYMFMILRLNRNKSAIKNLWFCLMYKSKTKCSLSTLFKIIKCVFTKKHPRSSFKITLDFKPDYHSD